MTNPIIDAIVWDTGEPNASAILLQTQLAALQAEWDTKLARFLQITSVAPKSLSSFQDLPRYRAGGIDNYLGLNPAEPWVDANLKYVRNQLLSALPFAGTGHSERLYLSQTSVKVPSVIANTVYLFQETVNLPRPAYVIGVHPVIVKASVGSPCNTLFRPQIDGSPVFVNVGDNNGIRPYPLIVTTESYFAIIWGSLDILDAGQHDIEMELFGTATLGNVAPFFDIYTSAIELGTMPTAYIQPPVSYLEFVYQ